MTPIGKSCFQMQLFPYHLLSLQLLLITLLIIKQTSLFLSERAGQQWRGGVRLLILFSVGTLCLHSPGPHNNTL
jgi:hypothetical protein